MPPATLTLAQCEAFFHLPVAEAALRLGVSRPTISKVLRRHGINRWPYRKLQAQRKHTEHRTPRNRPDLSPSDRVIQRPLLQARKHRLRQSRSTSRSSIRRPSSNQKARSRLPVPQSKSTRLVRRTTEARRLTPTPSSSNQGQHPHVSTPQSESSRPVRNTTEAGYVAPAPSYSNQGQRASVSTPQSESTRPVRLIAEARGATPTPSEHTSQSVQIQTPPSSCPSSPQQTPAQTPLCASPTPSEQCLPWPPCDPWGPSRAWGPPRPNSAKAVFGEAWTRGLFTEGSDGTHFQFLAPNERVCLPRLPSSASWQLECYEEFTQNREDEDFVIHFGEIDDHCGFGGIQF